MKKQLICAQTECVTKVSSCDQINMPFTEQIDRNDSKLRLMKTPNFDKQAETFLITPVKKQKKISM